VEGLDRVRERIAAAAARAGRDVRQIRLIAVSKTQPIEKLQEALAAGQRVFGENYAQELTAKSAQLPGVEWHFIGALQSNKAKLVVGRAAFIHTCDRLSLAREISKRADAPQRVLLEVNAGREPQKAGALPEETEALLEQIRALPNLRCEGLRCIPPAAGDPRPHFRALRELAETLKLPELSMGMSADFEAAIEEGATMVRVGTAIFGARPAP
jgi:PLP dependent protein